MRKYYFPVFFLLLTLVTLIEFREKVPFITNLVSETKPYMIGYKVAIKSKNAGTYSGSESRSGGLR